MKVKHGRKRMITLNTTPVTSTVDRGREEERTGRGRRKEEAWFPHVWLLIIELKIRL